MVTNCPRTRDNGVEKHEGKKKKAVQNPHTSNQKKKKKRNNEGLYNIINKIVLSDDRPTGS